MLNDPKKDMKKPKIKKDFNNMGFIQWSQEQNTI